MVLVRDNPDTVRDNPVRPQARVRDNPVRPQAQLCAVRDNPVKTHCNLPGYRGPFCRAIADLEN